MLYGIITNLTNEPRHIAMVEYQIIEDSTDTVVVQRGTIGFNWVNYDVNGVAISETDAQRRARLRSEFDNYMKRLIDQMVMSDSKFETLKTQAIGYRYPSV
jgi:hypothetical protein